MIRKNIILILITLVIYAINQNVKMSIANDAIRWFMTCYFNDMIGGITFTAYCCIFVELYKGSIIKLYQIEGILFLSGVFGNISHPCIEILQVIRGTLPHICLEDYYTG